MKGMLSAHALTWLRNYVISPQAPIIIYPKVASDIPRNPILIWHVSDSATSYNVQVTTNRAFASVLIDTTVIDTTVQLDTLNAFTRYYWRVSASNEKGTSEFSTSASFVTGDQITAVSEIKKVPVKFKLFQNYPNPFNPSTNIMYFISQATIVTLDVYDILGRNVQSLVNSKQSPGQYTVTFDASNLSSGIYFYRLVAGSFVDVKQILLMK